MSGEIVASTTTGATDGNAEPLAPTEEPPVPAPTAAEETLTPEQERVLLATLPSRPLLDLLRSLDGLADSLFVGFRLVPANLKHPEIRRRLLREVADNPDLRQHLRALWQEVHGELVDALRTHDVAALSEALPALVERWDRERVQLALLLDDRPEARAVPLPPAEPPEPTPTRTPPPAGTDQAAATHWREQVRSLRSELQEARKEAAALRAQLAEAQRVAEEQRAAAGESDQQAATLSRALERSTRQAERLQKANRDLEARQRETARQARRLEEQLEALRRQEEERARAEAEQQATEPPAAAWLEAACDLVRQGNAPAAVAIMAPLLRQHPRAAAVRAALAEAYEASGAVPAAITELCWLARWHREQGRATESFALAARALLLAPHDSAARRAVAKALAAISPGDEAAWAAVRHRLRAVEKASPTAGQVLASLLPATRAGQAPHLLDLDTLVAWPEGGGASFQASLREVIAAVDANQTEVVWRVRQALSRLKMENRQLHRAVLRVLRRYDDSYRSVLVRPTRPVVVDGSNVAWRAPEADGRPRLRHILTLRRELRGLGYFPILVYIDAALLHQIDQRPELEALAARGEVLVADPGTDADESILRHARKLGCVVVTNDRMVEHDLEDTVTKLRFEVGPEGAVIRQWHEHQGQ